MINSFTHSILVQPLLITLMLCFSAESSASSKLSLSKNSLSKPHVLFISIDDLRPLIGSYGAELAITPNIDKLAEQGIQFNRAYAQQAICGPSRASVLTGLRPNTLGVTHNYIKFREKESDVVTLPQAFMAEGYTATYVGKIFHHGDKDEFQSWNYQPAKNKLPKGLKKPPRYALKKNNELQANNKKAMFKKYGASAKYGLGSGPAIEGADVPDTAYIDGYNTELAIVTIKELAKKVDKPIFFGFGMNKPHLPWLAPKKYWDMYDAKEIKLSMQKQGPKFGASVGLHASFELRTFFGIPKDGEISRELAVQLKHAYLACVSYIDAQIGRLIKTYQEEGLLDNTLIVLWSDHGYHLGEMGIWGKASNYEIATRVPLIFSTPQQRQADKPITTNALVELIDIYPTLLELANINIPEKLEGKSLVPLFTQPELNIKTAAFSQFPTPALREWGAYPLRKGMRETYFGPLIDKVEQKIATQFSGFDRDLFERYLMGYSMRTSRYRLISWQDIRQPNQSPVFVELYDHQIDPNETINIAHQSPDLVNALLNQLSKADIDTLDPELMFNH